MAYQTEELISVALEKVRGDKEKDLCKYLPGIGSGHMHHFTLKKIKKARPEELKALLQEFILNQPSPRMIEPKHRARKNKKLDLNRIDMKLILELVQKSGDKYLLSNLGGKR